MTKEEIIKKYYGGDYDRAKESLYGIDENGFSSFYAHFNESFLHGYEIFNNEEEILVRPLGLGEELDSIKNNNGWTVLNKETYDELENDYYMWYNNKNGDWEIDDLSDTHIENYTHFQKIQVPPNPPIY